MKPIYKPIVFAVVALALCQKTGAQQQYKVRFRGLSWDLVITDLNFAHGTKLIPMTLLPNGRSPFYEYQGTDPMLFFREVTGTDGKMNAEVSGSVPLAQFRERTLLIFFNKPAAANYYDVAAVDDSDAKIPPGFYSFMNLSKLPLQIKCGTSQGMPPQAGRSRCEEIPPMGGALPASKSMPSHRGATDHAYSNVLPFGPTTRTLVFVYQAPETGAFLVKRIAEDATMIPRPSPAARRPAK